MLDKYKDIQKEQPFNSIVMHDELSEVLGEPKDGIFEYIFDDIVKLTGHSCPTAASTYMMIKVGLEMLYVNAIPERGHLRISIKGNQSEGVNGVIGSIATYITGASGEEGFNGINGKFGRRNRITFNPNQKHTIVIICDDNKRKVGINFLMHKVPSNPLINEYLQLIIAGKATEIVHQEFKAMWQSRVQWILNHQHYKEIIECTYL